MVTVLPSDFNSVSARLPCYLSKSPLKRDFLEIYLTTSFGILKFKNTSAMRVIFFWKCSKLNLNLENPKKNSGKVFLFRDNRLSIGWNKFSLLRTEYLSSPVNGLTNSPKILLITLKSFFCLNCLHIDQ